MIFETSDGYVKSEIHQRIAQLIFFTKAKNSLPKAILQNLAHQIKELSNNPDVGVIILKSEGETVFCSGASFDELVAIQNEKDGKEFFMGFANVINAMRKCYKPIIGLIQGKCVGGGVGLVAACDYAITVNSAQVKLSELAVGIGPFVVGPVIEKKIGTSAFMQLALDAHKWRDADWAKRKGLFAETHPNLADAEEAVYTLANSLVKTNPEALRELKKVFWDNTQHWDELLMQRAEISGRLVLSEFTKNFINSFKQKLSS